MTATERIRLTRKHPTTGAIEERCHYVMLGGEVVGRVRYNDGWNASTWTGDRWETIAGTWRTRGAAVDGVLFDDEADP